MPNDHKTHFPQCPHANITLQNNPKDDASFSTGALWRQFYCLVFCLFSVYIRESRAVIFCYCLLLLYINKYYCIVTIIALSVICIPRVIFI